jgi:membrane protein DedA with SNARE-associated domain
MFAHLTHQLLPLLQEYGALGVFLASIIEEIIAPIPSTVVVLTASFFLTEGLPASQALPIIILQIMLPASLGISIGSLFPYFLARIGEKVAIDRFGKFLGVSWKMVEDAERWFKKHHADEAAIFITRAIPGLPSVLVGLFCGLIRIPVHEFLIWSFLGSLVRTFSLGIIGWYAGKTYKVFASEIGMIENSVVYIFAVLGLVFVAYIVFRQWKKSRKQ